MAKKLKAFFLLLGAEVEATLVGCLALVCLLSSCGGGNVAKSQTIGGGTFTLTANPNSISFGDVAIGASSSQTITVSNSGTASVTVSQASLTGAGFTITGPSLPASLGVGQTAIFTVQFSPSVTGSAAGTVTIVSNARNSPTTVSITGNGVSSLLNASPASINFGNVSVGGSSTQTVALTSTGSASVTISQANVTGTGFSISGLSLPLTLAGGQSTTFSVKFAPLATGSVTGNVSVVSSASKSPTNVSLIGNGVATSHSVQLTWDPSSSPVAGYNAYGGSTSGGPYAKLNGTLITVMAYTDNTVLGGQTYFYVVTAVDSNNVESVFSIEVQALVPTP